MVVHRLIKLLTALVLVLTFYFLVFRYFGIQIKETAFSRQPENSTELYFADHTMLPKSVETGEVYSFEFIVKNLENMDIDYSYLALLSYGDLTTTIAEGEFFLPDNEERITEVAFTVPRNLDRGKVTVSLKNPEENIHFWIESED